MKNKEYEEVGGIRMIKSKPYNWTILNLLGPTQCGIFTDDVKFFYRIEEKMLNLEIKKEIITLLIPTLEEAGKIVFAYVKANEINLEGTIYTDLKVEEYKIKFDDYIKCKTVDEANKVIVLSPTYGFPDVLLEYIGSPQQNDDYVIQTACQEAVIAFISWKMKTGNQQDYYSRLIEARRKLKPVTLQEIQQAIRENQKYSLKA